MWNKIFSFSRRPRRDAILFATYNTQTWTNARCLHVRNRARCTSTIITELPVIRSQDRGGAGNRFLFRRRSDKEKDEIPIKEGMCLFTECTVSQRTTYVKGRFWPQIFRKIILYHAIYNIFYFIVQHLMFTKMTRNSWCDLQMTSTGRVQHVPMLKSTVFSQFCHLKCKN